MVDCVAEILPGIGNIRVYIFKTDANAKYTSVCNVQEITSEQQGGYKLVRCSFCVSSVDWLTL